MMGGMTATMIEVDGGTVWADDAGGDGPALVLLHPGVGDSRIWDPVLPALAAKYRVIRYDARGFGHSPAPTTTFSLLRDLVTVLGHYDVKRAAIVGCSQGGGTALGLALQQPERVPALVLLCPGIPGIPLDDDSDEGAVLGAEWERAEAAGDVDALASVTQRVWGRAGATPEAMEQFRSSARAVLSTGDLEQEDPPVYDRLTEIAVPTSLLVGDADFAPLIEADKAAAARIPGCELILVPGMDHLPPLRDPDLVLQTITSTLARASWLRAWRSRLRRAGTLAFPSSAEAARDRGGIGGRGGGHGPFGQLVVVLNDALGGEHADDQQRRADQLGRAGGLAEQRPRARQRDDRGQQHPRHHGA
jgi:3-oxoadipate enol-lactonase